MIPEQAGESKASRDLSCMEDIDRNRIVGHLPGKVFCISEPDTDSTTGH